MEVGAGGVLGRVWLRVEEILSREERGKGGEREGKRSEKARAVFNLEVGQVRDGRGIQRTRVGRASHVCF